MSIVSIIVTLFFILMTYRSCKVSSWADQDMDGEEKDEKIKNR